jgi:hypothetical protein
MLAPPHAHRRDNGTLPVGAALAPAQRLPHASATRP